MRYAKFFFFALFIFSIAFVQSCNSSSAKDAVLKFNLQKGKAYAYTMDMDMETEVQGRNTKNEMKFNYDMEVVDDKDGVKTVKTTYKRVVMKMDGGAMSIDTDNDKPAADSATDLRTNPMGMMSNMFRAIVGKSFTMKVNAEGKVTEISGVKEMEEAMLKSMNVNTEMARVIESAFRSQFNEKNLKQSFEQAFNIFPNKAVKVGDTWDKTTDMEGPMAAKTKTTYTVKKIAGDDVTLDVNSTVQIGTKQGTQTGTMVVDSETGLITGGELVQKFDGMMKMTNKMKITGTKK